MHMKYIMNIIIYLRSTITEMRDSRFHGGQRYKGLFCGAIARNMGWCITAASQLKGKGQEPRMRSEFRIE